VTETELGIIIALFRALVSGDLEACWGDGWVYERSAAQCLGYEGFWRRHRALEAEKEARRTCQCRVPHGGMRYGLIDHGDACQVSW
jgi:hypothetical protein